MKLFNDVTFERVVNTKASIKWKKKKTKQKYKLQRELSKTEKQKSLSCGKKIENTTSYALYSVIPSHSSNHRESISTVQTFSEIYQPLSRSIPKEREWGEKILSVNPSIRQLGNAWEGAARRARLSSLSHVESYANVGRLKVEQRYGIGARKRESSSNFSEDGANGDFPRGEISIVRGSDRVRLQD